MERTVCGVNIHFEQTGAGDDRVLLLHGWGCSSRLMMPVANGLKHVQTLIPDFPGHGNSGRPPEPWGVSEYAECLRQLLTELNFLPCRVIAHSFGCRVALYLASEHPEMFTQMILTGAAGLRAPQTEEGRKRSEEYRKLRDKAQKIGKIPFMGHVADRMQERLRKQYGSADYNALDEEMRRTFVKVINLDLSDRLPRIQCPTLLIWGNQDKETPLWMGRKMEQDIPDAALILFEDGTHFAYLEQCTRFCTIANQFFGHAE